MSLVNFILDLAGLLLWLNWRSDRFDPLVRRMPATLMGTLRPAAPKKFRRWHFLVFIASLLLLRAAIYQLIGKETYWSGKLDLGVVVLWFATNSHWIGFLRMAVFSFASFGLTLAVFYFWVLFLSLLAGPLPVHGLVTIPLGRIDRWPRWAKLVLPFVATAIVWWGASWIFERLQVVTPMPLAGRFQQALVLGVVSYFQWQYPVEVILFLHLLNSYIYFGKHPLWKYVNATAQTILLPLRRVPLQIGKVDFAPLAGLVAVFLLANCIEYGFKTPFGDVKGLIDLYRRLPL